MVGAFCRRWGGRRIGDLGQAAPHAAPNRTLGRGPAGSGPAASPCF